MRRSILPLLLLAALSFVISIGRGAIADSDEAFYAEAAREMVESGDWLTPHFNYELRFQKPILYYWLTAGLGAMTGPTEASSRFWSALSGIGLALVVAACGRRWFDEATGLLAGAITATSFGYFALARMALPDLPLAFFTTLSIWAAFVATLEREPHPRRWLLLAAAAAALGFLTKGPLALILPTIVVAPILLLERRSFNLRLADVLWAATLFTIIAAPWYAAMGIAHGVAYLSGFFVGDNYERFATTRFNDPRPWWFYLPVLAGGLLPWTPLTLVWLKPLRAFLMRRQGVGAVEVRLLLWAALPLLFFTLSVGKQPRYVLPVLPPVALLLAGSIVERTNAWQRRDGLRMRPSPDRLVVAGCALAAAVLLLLAGLIYRARALFLNVPPVTATVVVSTTAVAAIGVLVLCFSRAWRAAPAGLAVATATAFATLPFAVFPASSDAAVHKMAEMVRAAHTGNEVIGTYRVFVRNLVFYSGIVHTDINNDDHLREWLASHGSALVVMPSADADRLEKLSWLTLERLGALPYFDDGSLRVGTLLWPDPATDLDTVVLARLTHR